MAIVTAFAQSVRKDAKQTEFYAQNLHKICIIILHAITTIVCNPQACNFGKMPINKWCGNAAIVPCIRRRDMHTLSSDAIT